MITEEELADHLVEWAAVADSRDHIEIASVLMDALPATVQARDDITQTRALLRLQEGRGQEALDLLTTVGDGPAGPASLAGSSLPLEEGRTELSIIEAACRAALGDRTAYGWLLRTAARGPGPGLTRILADTATRLGDRQTADDAWARLVTTYGSLTRVTAPRYAAVLVSKRDRRKAVEAINQVVSAANILLSLAPSAADDPQPTLAAVTDLQERGDTAGARLLLRAVAMRIPAPPELDAAMARITPQPAMRRHRMATIGIGMGRTALGLLALFVPVLWVPCLPVVLSAGRLWHRFASVPGFDLTDSRVWRTLDTVHLDPVTGRPRPRSGDLDPMRVAAGVGGLLAGFFALMGLGSVFPWILGQGASDDDAIPLVALWISCLVGPTAAALRATTAVRTHTALARRDRDRRAAEQKALADAGHCRCWSIEYLTSAPAARYLTQHLVPPAHSALPDSLISALDDRSAVGCCPDTGAAWLGATLPPSRTMVLLRAAPPKPEPHPPAQGTGFYL